MSDDDSESDIETMFQDAHNNIARKTDDRLNDDESDGSDNDENDTKNAALATSTPNYFMYSNTKKRKKSAVDKKIEQLSQRKAKQEQIDKRNSNKLHRITNDDDDDDDDFLNDDDVKVVGATSTTTTTGSTIANNTNITMNNGITTRSGTMSTNTTKPPNYVEPSITLLDSDDDEDNGNNKNTTAANNSTFRNIMHHPNPTAVPPSYPNNLMNQYYTAMMNGNVVPGGMILPSSSIPNQNNHQLMMMMMMNQQIQQRQVPQQSHLLSSVSLPPQLYEQQLQQQRIKSAVANLSRMNQSINIDEEVTTAPTPSNGGSSLLRIKVIATIVPSQGSSKILEPTLVGLPVVDLTSDESTHSSVAQIKGSRTVSCLVDILETSTVQVLMDRILEHYLKLNLKQNVIGLRYNNEPLYPKHTLDMYRIPVSGGTIAATVQSSDTMNTTSITSTGTNRHSNQSVNASSFAAVKPKAHVPKGTLINLLLRRSKTINGKVTSEEISISIGNLDPLQVLVDKYRQHHLSQPNLGGTTHKITLQFDGDTIVLERTPKQYDMESDDLIDVIVT